MIVQEPISDVPVVSKAYSRFAADVIHLCKLRVHHVGAHLRCEISCKYIAISIVPSFKYVVLYISREKNPESQENIFLRIPVLSNYAEDLESHVQGDILRKFMWLVSI